MSPSGQPPGARERGAAVVEFALVLPVFMALVLGMITGGILANRQLEVTHAAREGGRYGAMLPVDETFSSGNWSSRVRDVVVERSDGQLTTEQVCVALVSGTTPVAVSDNHSTRSGNAACFDDSADGNNDLRVQVRAATSGTLEVLFFTREVALTAEVVARHEGT